MRQHTISFRHAADGILIAAKTQANYRFHLLATSLVLILALWLKLSLSESLILILTVAMVLVAELFNTAIESLCDAVTLETKPLIGRAKDVSAGAVLVSAIFAVLVGIVLFVPKILAQL